MEVQTKTILDRNTFLQQAEVIPFIDIVNAQTEIASTDKPFIEANTIAISFEEVNDKHIIPVFIKDNEPLISHADFIQVASMVVSNVFHGEVVCKPNIRVSHPIKGRIPDAKSKAASELLESEKTLYYERMAFVIEVPSIFSELSGNTLTLTIGGIKAFNLDNLYGKKGNDEHFKIFIGFQNKVCTNLCVWTDGLQNDLQVSNLRQLQACIRSLLETYNTSFHLTNLKALNNYSLTEKQFAHLIGKCRMYPYLPKIIQKDIPKLLYGDNQISAVCKDYYRDNSFCKDNSDNINLWNLYNLFTGVNKSSYIDGFVEKSVNAFDFVNELRWALENKTENWFLQ